MVNLIKKLWNDEAGAAAAEYALILAIVGSGIAVAAIGLGDAISGALDDAAGCIETPGEAACGGAAAPAS